MAKKKFVLPDSYYNKLSFIGTFVAGISFLIILFLIFFSEVLKIGSSYSGLITYIIMPVFLVIGLLLIPIGMYFKHKKIIKPDYVPGNKLPNIDFNNKRTWNAFMVFAPATVILIIFTTVGSYRAFHFTESVEFCGKLCHVVMEPEYVAYQHSSHSKISCVECHVGAGTNWYVKSKLSGMYQVYAVLTNNFPRPIPTPIHNLRPARETCEECHWPEKFYPQSLVVEKHFLADEENSEWDIYMQMKTGPANSGDGLKEGIHWHINPNVKIEYKPTDNSREAIPWVKYTNLKTGKVTIYKDENQKSIKKGESETRTMDCMDCHNRPSHNYRSPMKFINNALAAGTISKELPDIKTLAMEIFGQEYSSKDSAMIMIEKKVNDYYKLMYEDLLVSKRGLLDKAIKTMQAEYSYNIFPAMKVSWEKYPNHIGHLEFMGCFRCHDDKHKSESGKVISRDCDLCHSIIAQGNPKELAVANTLNSLVFQHPNDANQAWKKMLCVECHKELYKY